MCKTPCCPPQSGGSGPGAIIAVITGIIVVPIALRLLIEVLRLIELIMLTLTGAALLGLITWAAICWHRRALTRASQARVLVIATDPATGLPATTRPRRSLTGEHTARPLAITADHQDPADAGSLIRGRRTPHLTRPHPSGTLPARQARRLPPEDPALPEGHRLMKLPGAAPGILPAGPVLSMFDPIYVGIDEFGHPVQIRIIYRNLLAAGEPGGGKSGLLNILAAHVALSANTRMVLFDGKQVELGMWDQLADEFVGPDLHHAIITLLRLQRVMDNRYAWLRARRRRKIEPGDGISVITSIFDEIALYATVLGTEQQQHQFVCLLRDLVARGRAAAMPVIAATQRPSVDIIPKSLRDLFGYRAAFRCTSTGSSDIILGDGWSAAGFSATGISPLNQGEAFLIAEGGTPQRIKVAYLTDTDIIALADHAAALRRTPPVPTAGPAIAVA